MITTDPSLAKTGPADKIKKDPGAPTSSAARAAAAGAADKISSAADKIADDLGANESSAARTVADSATKIKRDLGAAGSDLADKAGDVANAAQEALTEMRKIIDQFAAKTGVKASEAMDTVKATGVETADHIGVALNSAGALGKEGIDGMAEAVAKRPMTAMAIALGVGLLVGLASRGGSRA